MIGTFLKQEPFSPNTYSLSLYLSGRMRTPPSPCRRPSALASTDTILPFIWSSDMYPPRRALSQTGDTPSIWASVRRVFGRGPVHPSFRTSPPHSLALIYLVVTRIALSWMKETLCTIPVALLSTTIFLLPILKLNTGFVRLEACCYRYC